MHRIVVFCYRIGSKLYRLKVPVIPQFLTYINRIVFGIWLPSSAVIGPGLVLGYGGLGVVIHGRTIIGKNCHIDQNVTIGGTSKKIDVPKLGNEVYVGAGAKIIGPIKIGDNVVIGANSVVINDVPANTVVVGVPGRIVKRGTYKSDYV